MHNTKIIIIFLGLTLAACNNHSITFHEDIKPIIHRKCAVCHHQNGSGPFQLVSYNDINKRKDMVLEVIQTDYMPPWPADPNYRTFINDRSLNNEEKEIIIHWLQNDALEGTETNNNIVDSIILNQAQEKQPDLKVTMKEPYTTNGLNNDEFLMMKFPFELEKDTFISKIEFVPDNKQIVHHVNAHLISYNDGAKSNIFKGKRVVNTEVVSDHQAFEQLDLLNDDTTYPVLTPSVSNYLPGSETIEYPSGIGVHKASKKNIILVNDFHYAPTPYEELDSSHFNIYFTNHPPERIIKETQLGTFGISKITPPLIIPPNEISKFTTKAMITKDISVLTINPHMHLLGKSFLAYAITLSNDTIPLIKIDNWNFRWQYFYTFKTMLKIPAGSEIIVEATYDNTVNNPDNPFSPPQQITERINANGKGSMKTSDEMLQFIINYLDYQQGDENIILGL